MNSSDKDWESLIPDCFSPEGLKFARDASKHANALSMLNQAREAGASGAQILSAIKASLEKKLADPFQIEKEARYAQQILGLNIRNTK